MKYLSSAHQNSQGHQKQVKSEKLSLSKGAERDMIKCNTSRMGPWNRKKDKIKEI